MRAAAVIHQRGGIAKVVIGGERLGFENDCLRPDVAPLTLLSSAPSSQGCWRASKSIKPVKGSELNRTKIRRFGMFFAPQGYRIQLRVAAARYTSETSELAPISGRVARVGSSQVETLG